MTVTGTVYPYLYNVHPYTINYVATVQDGQVIEYSEEIVDCGMDHMTEDRDEAAYMNMVANAIEDDVAKKLDNAEGI